MGTGRGSLCPTRASPLPQPSRFQGPRRRPLHGPCGPPPPGRAAPSDSRGRDHLPFPTITPTDSGTHPPGHQCQRRLPGPRTYLHGSTKPRSGGGESSALLCLSLALPEHIVSGIGWWRMSVRAAGRDRRGRGCWCPGVSVSVYLSVSVSLWERRDI